MSDTVLDGMGGARTTLGAQPISFLISLRMLPCFPMTSPGAMASMVTSPVSSSKYMSVICASSGMISRRRFSTTSGSARVDGSGLMATLRRRPWASCLTISLLEANLSMSLV